MQRRPAFAAKIGKQALGLTTREAGVDEVVDILLVDLIRMMAGERGEAAKLLKAWVRERTGQANAQRPFDKAAEPSLRIDFLRGVDPLGKVDHPQFGRGEAAGIGRAGASGFACQRGDIEKGHGVHPEEM